MAVTPSYTDIEDRQFKLLINSVVDYAIYMLDTDGRVISWNPGARRFKGYEAHEIIGHHFSRFFTEEDRVGGLAERALRAAAEEGRFEAEGWRVRKDGSRFWASIVIDPVRDESGRLIGYAKITRDITEKRKADQRLFESEQRFRMLVRGVRDYAIYLLDPEGHVTNWNMGAQAVKGYGENEIVGKHFSRFYTEKDRETGLPARALATALGEGKYEAEGWRLRKDGSRFWAHVVIDPIHNDDGEHIGFAKITRDVTERRRAQQELDEARAALFQSQKLQALGELTGGIAHDFNNLMTVIRGSADLLRRPLLSEEKKDRYLKAIIETADRAATLTSHLLAFGRRQPLKPEVIDLNVRLDALGELLARTLGGRIEVKLEIESALWPTEVDSAQLETALLNAAINARDAMPDGGELLIATRNIADAQSDMICISLRDMGTGMEPDVLDRAFEPFFTTKPVGQGTGLGLSQIHGFAAQSGGRAEIESAAGQGTTIKLFLPRSTKEIPKASEKQGIIAGGKGKRILLVEDNEHVREFATDLLSDLHYEVICAASAEEALDLLDTENIDILFSDIVMPDMSGLELAHLVRAKFPQLPLLLASGYSDEITGGVAGDFEVIHKPYGAESLGMALASAFREAKQLSA